MADNLTRAQRVAAMRGVKSTNTTPELVIRSLLRRMGLIGYRFIDATFQARQTSLGSVAARLSTFMVVFGTGTIAVVALECRRRDARIGERRSSGIACGTWSSGSSVRPRVGVY